MSLTSRRVVGALTTAALGLAPLAVAAPARADVGVVTFVFYSGPDATGTVLGTEVLIPLPGVTCQSVSEPPGAGSYSVTNDTVAVIDVGSGTCPGAIGPAAVPKAAGALHEIPQLVMLTFDDAITVANYGF